jgi:hypothetical protein
MAKAHVYFDVDGDGTKERVGWTGAGDGFLVIDRDGDGKITDGSELTFGPENKDAHNALDALAALDNNGDRVIDASDARFGELKVWVDANGNGISDAGELKTLADLGIKSIGLASHDLEGTIAIGDNALVSTAVFTRSDGTTGTVGDTALAFRDAQGLTPQASETAQSVGLQSPASADDLVAQMRSIVEGGQEGSPSSAASHNWQYGPAVPAPTLLPATDLAAEGEDQRLLALMAQDMATFGAPNGQAALDSRERLSQGPFDFFA